MPAEQFVRVDSFELAAQALVGQVTYSASGLDADSQLTFALGGSLAEAFAISSDGDIVAVAAVSRADFPVLLLVSAALGGEVAARTRLLIERRPDLVPTPAPSIELPAVQHLVAADVGVGAVVGRLQFVVQPTGLQPVLTLSGEGAEYFVVDSAGMVSVAGLDSAGMALATTLASAESFNFRLILSAVLPLTDTVAQSTITISSVPVVPTVRPPPPPPPPPPPVVPRPNSVVPLPADARVFMPDQVVEIDSGLAYSEATAPGTCVVRFALARVEDDPCWALVPVAGTAGGQGYTVVYEVLDAGVDNFVMSGNTLLLKSRQRLVGLGAPTATVGLVSNVRVRGRFAGSVQTSEIVIRLTPVLPTIEYNGTTFTDVPITDTLIDIGKLGFSIVGGAPDRRLQYFLEGNSANLPLSISHDGILRYDGSQARLAAARLYEVGVVAVIEGYAQAGQLGAEILFATVPPRLSFARPRYDFFMATVLNTGHAYVDTIEAQSSSAGALLHYDIVEDVDDQFYVGSGGRIYLTRPLTTTATAQMRVRSGEAEAVTTFNVHMDEIDFTAVPVDASISRRRIRFTPVVADALAITSYLWEFGDGSPPSSERSPVHLFENTQSYVVRLIASNNAELAYTVSHTVYPHQAADPFQRLQWHLRQPTVSPFLGEPATRSLVNPDTGQLNPLTFSTKKNAPYNLQTRMFEPLTLTAEGEDIRAVDHLSSCGVLDTCRGEGIVVQIVDTGVQVDHPDLISNTRRRLSRNLIRGAPDIYNPYTPPSGSPATLVPGTTIFNRVADENSSRTHGTAVAGIIAAQDANDIGVVGIAPRAELASYNTLGSGGSGAYVQSFAADYDVANHSWGITFRGIEYLRIGQIERDAIAQAVREGRGGRGSVLVKAAGNSGAGSARARGVLAYINAFGNHHSSGLDGHNALPEILTVGAVRASGEENVDSEGGSNVLLSAYWNLPCRYYPNSEHLFAVVNPVGIVTTDLVGDFGHTWGVEPVFISAVNNTPSTFLGGSQALLRELLPSLGNAIEVEPLANTNDYQYCFNGTSAATPQVTGAVALMLQARPQLSWRDVRAILAETARQSDADNPQWAINGAGLSYHPTIGYGVLDTTAAVNRARTWTLFGAEETVRAPAQPGSFTISNCTSNCSSEAPSIGTETIASTTVTEPLDYIETVQAQVEITFGAASRASLAPVRGSISISLEHRDDQGNLINRTLMQKRHPYYESLTRGGGQVARSTQHYEFSWTYLNVHHLGESTAGTWNLVVSDHIEDSSIIRIKSWQLIFRGHNR